jgi:hypothetical protein
MTWEEKQKVLEHAKFIAKGYQCPWDLDHINALEDFWNIAQEDLGIPTRDKISLPDEFVMFLTPSSTQ